MKDEEEADGETRRRGERTESPKNSPRLLISVSQCLLLRLSSFRLHLLTPLLLLRFQPLFKRQQNIVLILFRAACEKIGEHSAGE